MPTARVAEPPQAGGALLPEWNADLMGQRDFLPLSRRLQDPEADLHGCQSPLAGMERRVAVQDSADKFVDDLGAWDFRRGQGVEPALLISVDHYAVRQRAQIGVLAGDDDGAVGLGL